MLARTLVQKLPIGARAFSSTCARNAAEVKRLGVVGAGQMVSPAHIIHAHVLNNGNG